MNIILHNVYVEAGLVHVAKTVMFESYPIALSCGALKQWTDASKATLYSVARAWTMSMYREEKQLQTTHNRSASAMYTHTSRLRKRRKNTMTSQWHRASYSKSDDELPVTSCRCVPTGSPSCSIEPPDRDCSPPETDRQKTCVPISIHAAMLPVYTVMFAILLSH